MESSKRAFKRKHGFFPHEEECKDCGKRRADHTIWNTRMELHPFVSTGRKAKKHG